MYKVLHKISTFYINILISLMLCHNVFNTEGHRIQHKVECHPSWIALLFLAFSCTFRTEVMAYDFVVACTLHLLDIEWQLYDLSFLHNIQPPNFYIDLAKSKQSLKQEQFI